MKGSSTTPGIARSAAFARRPQLALHRKVSERLGSLTPPGGTAVRADALRARRQDRPFDELLGKDGMVCAAVSGGRQGPDVTRVLAKRMTGQSGGLEAVETGVLAR